MLQVLIFGKKINGKISKCHEQRRIHNVMMLKGNTSCVKHRLSVNDANEINS